MLREELVKVQIGDPLYNKATNQVIVMSSSWSADKDEIKDEEVLNYNNYGQNSRFSNGCIAMGDFDKWEIVTEDAPAEVRLRILTERFFQLETFTHSRLK